MNPEFIELGPKEANVFHMRIREAKKANPKGSAVDVHTVKDYANMRMFLTNDGKAGYAVNQQGELNSVFKHPESPYKNISKHVAAHSTLVGGASHASAFEPLYKMYGQGGAERTGTTKWNEDYKPNKWPTKKMGRPDVSYIAMGITPAKYENVVTEDYDEGMARAKSLGEQRMAGFRSRISRFWQGHNGAKG